MAYSSVIVACLVLVGLAGLGRNMAQAAQICGADTGELLLQCGIYVYKSGPKIPPSDECCGVVKGVDVPCACEHVSKAEDLVSLDKVVYVARYCGIKLQPGTKCGDYTIPPPKA